MVLSQTFNTVNDNAAFLMFDIKGSGAVNAELRINTKLEPAKEYVVFNKIKYNNYYDTFVSDTIDGNDSQYEIYHDTSRSAESIVAIRAPHGDPLKSSLRLLNTGVKTSQFVDLSSIRDNEGIGTRGRFEIGIRSFEADTPTPDFVVGFADTISGDLIHKLTIDHDALPIRFTNTGVQFRTNLYPNNTPTEGEIVTINFKDLKTNVDRMYNSMQAYGLLSAEIGEANTNINAVKINYDNDLWPTVDDALDHLIARTNTDKEALDVFVEETRKTVDALNLNMSVLDNNHKTDINNLKNTVDRFDDRITTSENNSSSALSRSTDNSAKISELEVQISSLRLEIENLRSELNNTKLILSNQITTLEQTIYSISGT